MQALFTDQAEDGNSAAFLVAAIAARKDYPGMAGETVTVITAGTFGEDAAVTLQAAPASTGPWVPLEDGAFTAATVKVMPLSRRAYIRAVVSGADTSTDVSLWVG